MNESLFLFGFAYLLILGVLGYGVSVSVIKSMGKTPLQRFIVYIFIVIHFLAGLSAILYFPAMVAREFITQEANKIFFSLTLIVGYFSLFISALMWQKKRKKKDIK